MRIRCKVAVCAANKPGSKPVLGSVAVGERNKEVHVTVSENVEKVFSKFASEGKVTIRMKQPNQDIMISNASPAELQMFMKVVSAASAGKELPKLQKLQQTQGSFTNYVTQTWERHLKPPPTCLNVDGRKNYPFSEGFPATLVHLNINNCAFNKIDHRWMKLKHLVTINFEGNLLGEAKFDDFDFSVFPLLENLNLSDNQIRQLGPGFWNGVSKKLRTLKLNKNFLNTLPERISVFAELQSLEVNENQLGSLPEDLGFCRKLTVLRANMNKIRWFPGSLRAKEGQGRMLDQLDLTLNSEEAYVAPEKEIFQIPAEIGRLFDLTVKFIWDNRRRIRMDEEKTPEKVAEGSDSGGQKRKRSESGSSDAASASGGEIPSWIAGASPPRFVSLEELMKTAKSLDKMALAHEIAVNDKFRIESRSPEPGTLEEKVTTAVHSAFWDLLSAQLNESPPSFEHAFALLAELKETLLSLLLPHHIKLKSEIEDHLDLELLRQQCDHDCLDVRSVAGYVLGIMGKLCAPVRDDKIKELQETQELIPLLKGILELLDLMKLDMANFTLSACRPTIQQHSVEYEREQFQQFLNSHPGGLRHTEAWIQRAMDIYNNETIGTQPAMKSIPSTSRQDPDVSARNVVNSAELMSLAYWELLEWCDNRAFPETLLVDQARLYDMRNRCLQLIISTSAVIVATNLAGRTIGDLPNFRTALKDHLLIILEDCEQRMLRRKLINVVEQILKEIADVINEQGLAEWDEKRKESLRSQIMDLSRSAQPVRKLIRDRMKTFVRLVIHNPNASPIKLPPGLSLIQPELARLAGQFLRLVSHNRQVFADHYDRIIGELSRDTNGNQEGEHSEQVDETEGQRSEIVDGGDAGCEGGGKTN